MIPPRPTLLAQMILRPALREGDLAIDATAGHGHDTRFLAQCVGASGRVLAFDVQKAALDSTRARLAAADLTERVALHQTSHAQMAQHVAPGSVAAVMFNLGYLPGEDHALTTVAGETLTALTAAAEVLKPGGILSVICYSGHPAGTAESHAVHTWLATQADRGWRVASYGMLGTRRPAPALFVACKPHAEDSLVHSLENS